MKRKQYTNRKGINPVLFQMSEEQKAATHMRAANKAHKLLTDKVLHDVFGFGPVRRERFRIEYEKQLDLYRRGYYTVDDLLELAKKEWKE